MTDDASTGRRPLALGVLMPGFVGTTLPDWVRDLLRDGLAGVCLFAHNIESLSQLSGLTATIYAANPTAIVSIDEEGGDVSRLHQRNGSPFPGNAILGRLNNLTATRAVGREVGDQLAQVGVHLTLAPDADVNSNPDNPVIGVRSFGADPQTVASHTAAWTDGVQAAGVAACAKHFPGHGDTSTDSHRSEPVITADRTTLFERELVPFAAAVAAGTQTIMTSHIRVPALDANDVATFSSVILDDLLRGQLGFEGVIVTDALDMVGASGTRGLMGAAVASVAAGCDLLCLGSKNSEQEVVDVADAIVRADVTGALPVGRLDNASSRCATLAKWMTDRRVAAATDIKASRAPIINSRQVASTFSLSDRARRVLAARTGPVQWVEIEPEVNLAVGVTPLGPFFEGGAAPSLVVPVDDRGRAESFVGDDGVLTIVVGREFHRDHDAFRAATTIAERADALVVDMGYAHLERVDIATFGASRLAGEALLELVAAAA